MLSLYYTAGSAPCRLVLLVAAALELQLDLHELDLSKGEHLTPDFLKLNPQHTVPTLVEGEFSLWESRAVARYLAAAHGGAAGAALYPAAPRARALLDQRLDFDLGTLYPAFANFYYPTLFGGSAPDAALLLKLEGALRLLDSFLAGAEWAAGARLTLADLALVATVSTVDAAGVSLQPYPNVESWFARVRGAAPRYEEANQRGVDAFKQMVARLTARAEL